MQRHLNLLLAPLLSSVIAATACAETRPGQEIDESLSCTYSPKATTANPQPELETFTDCAVGANGEVRIAVEHLAAMDFDDDGLSRTLIAGQWYLLRADGTKLPVVAWDNGPDELSEGLVRTVAGGKIAYADKTLQIVVPPRYDWGWPFESGKALVCLGCRKEKPPGEEHTSVVGGTWGFIDLNGSEIVPVKHPREQARGELEKLQLEPAKRGESP